MQQLRIPCIASPLIQARRFPPRRKSLTGHSKLISWWCLFGVALFAVGCSSGSKTRFRAVNAVVDESDLNVLEDGNSVASSLAYGTSTGYISVHAGSHQIQIRTIRNLQRVPDSDSQLRFGDGYYAAVLQFFFQPAVAGADG
ncbi:MAG: hypothetical protein DMG88_09530 [Acidobacteria bacterium]|nr:MAG: hypothetical protein DMG88_09530 [Acidobacteriota bacterium]